MIVTTPGQFLEALERVRLPATHAAVPRGVFLVEPAHFSLSEESASDNRYMQLAQGVDPERALAQHRVLAEAIRRHARIPVQVFGGAADTPDAVFPNNVFATAEGTLLVGAMRHEVRRREATRSDIPEWFHAKHGYGVQRLDAEPGVVAELTGPLVIDRAHRIGYHGLTERLNEAGARAMHAAFDLRLGFLFDLAPGEYHTNVVMAVLASRALVVHEGSFADVEVPRAIARRYGRNVVRLSDEEKAAFAGNCIALDESSVWMSARAERALSLASRRRLDHAGFVIHTVELDEIEKAGGSLRCCVAEIY